MPQHCIWLVVCSSQLVMLALAFYTAKIGSQGYSCCLATVQPACLPTCRRRLSHPRDTFSITVPGLSC